jgi:hypothetical protein
MREQHVAGKLISSVIPRAKACRPSSNTFISAAKAKQPPEGGIQIARESEQTRERERQKLLARERHGAALVLYYADELPCTKLIARESERTRERDVRGLSVLCYG